MMNSRVIQFSERSKGYKIRSPQRRRRAQRMRRVNKSFPLRNLCVLRRLCGESSFKHRLLMALKLGRKHIYLLYSRRLGQQFRSFRHQGRRDLSRKMRLPSRFIRESIEDAERRRSKSDCEPGSCCRFSLNDCQTAVQEISRPLLLCRILLPVERTMLHLPYLKSLPCPLMKHRPLQKKISKRSNSMPPTHKFT